MSKITCLLSEMKISPDINKQEMSQPLVILAFKCE